MYRRILIRSVPSVVIAPYNVELIGFYNSPLWYPLLGGGLTQDFDTWSPGLDTHIYTHQYSEGTHSHSKETTAKHIFQRPGVPKP